jgi:hypothetical protein
VKIVDINVLIYAVDDRTKHHATARPWLDAAMTGSETVGLPTAVTVGFLRLTTNPRVMVSPLDVPAATAIIARWLDRPNVTVPAPTRRHFTVMAELLDATGVAGNLVSDAHLATLAIEHGATLCSYDADFARFPGVDWVSPALP